MTKTRTAIAAVAFTAAATLLTPAAPASAISHDLVVTASRKNVFRDMRVCRSWEGHTDSDADSEMCYSSIGRLLNGQNTRDELGWRDTDAVKVGAYMTLKWDRAGTDKVLAVCKDYTRWVKVQPSLTSGRKSVYQTTAGCHTPQHP